LGWSYNYGKGWAHLVLEQFEDATDALTKTDFNDAHLLLAIAHIRLGRLAEARAEVEKMMKKNPTITVALWRQGYCFKDSALLDRYSLDLARLGVPER
jgi:tetratricopeptide (TPR) repeat protein